MRYAPGIDDALFLRGDVPMTKKEIRALTLCQAAVQPTDTVLDIGAGTGSLSIEAALAAPQGRVIAVEKEAAGIELIGQNARKFGVDARVQLVAGRAPQALAALGLTYDVIFIGGSGGSLEAILDFALHHLNAGGRIVANAITLQNAAAIVAYCKAHKLVYEAVLLQASRLRQVGKVDMMIAQNPVYVIKMQAGEPINEKA